ncbi:MAG: tail fiber domain-containing protein [Alphaproteobacteria bacterium]|nr:MAG: tail fiber domain-containing protein [Alphaproteobacteria bacterium]
MARTHLFLVIGFCLSITAPLSAQIRTNSDDTAALPGLSWTSDTNTGVYNPAADIIGFSAGGTERVRFNAAGISTTGVVRATQFIGDGSLLTNVSGDNLGDHTATQAILGTVGTVALPGYTFSGDTNTGIYWVGADQIGLTVGGVQQLLIRSTGLTVSGSVLANNVGDIATAPSYSWSGDTNTGMYWPASDQIGITTGGTQRAVFSGTGLRVIGTITTTGIIDAGSYIYGYTGDSATAPGYTWSGDNNTGMFNASGDVIGFSTAGTERVRFNSAGISTTGSIFLNSGGNIVADSFDTTYSSSLGLYGGSATPNTGAAIALHGIDHSSQSGRMFFYATSDTTGTLLYRFYSRTTGGTNGTLLTLYQGGNATLTGEMTAAKFNGDGSGLTNIAGDDLGNHTATTTIKGANGTVALPAYTWAGDTNTGMYWVASDQIGVATGGVQQLLIRSTGLTISGSVLVNNVGDTAGAPSYSWSGDTNTGLYWAASDQIGITTGGAQRALINSTGLTVTGKLTTTGIVDAGAAIYGYSGDSVTAPGYTWSGDTNTGMYWVGADQIGIATGGVQQLLIRTTGLTISGSVLVNNVGDTAAAPSYSWSGDTNTGIYWAASDQIGITTGSAQRALINSTGLTVTGKLTTTGIVDAGSYIYGYAGDSATAPGYTWSGDTNTGMYNAAADQIGFTAGGTQRLRVITTGAVVTGNMTATAFLYSSDKRLKTDIEPLPSTLEQLAKIGTYTYRYKSDENKEQRIGVIAQEVMPLFPEAVRNDENNMMSVDYPSLVPVLIKAVNELNAQMKDAQSQITELKASNEAMKKSIEALTTNKQ